MGDARSGNAVLIIDDDPVFRESAGFYLEGRGFTVFHADSAREGLDMFRAEAPDLILADLIMPEVDGLAVLAAVSAQSPETPVLVVSGTDVLHDVIEALRLGAWDYLTKPIQNMEILEHAVLKALERSRLMKENRKYRERLEQEIKMRTAELEDRTRRLEIANEKLKKEMDERRGAEERYKALFENSPISLWEEDFSGVKRYIDGLREQGVTDFDAYFEAHPSEIERCLRMIRITDVNRATLEMYEAGDKAALLGPLDRIVSARSAGAVRKQLAAAAEGKTFEMEIMSRTLKKNKRVVTIKSSIPPGFEETWEKVFISVHDLTDRIRAEAEKKRLETQLHHAQKMEAIGTLAGGIAHDFNNILFPIMGYAEMARDNLPSESANRRYVDEILKATFRARDLVSQILAFSRQTDAERRPIQITSIIKEAVKLLRAILPSSIEIRQRIRREDGRVLADPTQIHQVMINLCTNAYHAMRETGGVLEIALDAVQLTDRDAGAVPDMPSGSYLKLTVSDTGCGMPPEVTDHIFDPYFTTKERGEGTGLGLSVVHGIIKGCDGHIKVFSAPGKGTTFHIYIPAAEGDAPSFEQTAQETVPTGRERILLVDDEEQIIRMERQMLERLGYTVASFTGSAAALERFKQAPADFDLVITDMTMPGMSGVALTRALLEIRPDTPVILCTGFSELISKESAQAAGVKEYVMKPMLRKDIARAIRQALDR